MTVSRKLLPVCPIECCIAIIAGRWKAMVLWRLFDGPLRYSEMSQRIPEITERVLSQVLKELERDGVVIRSEQPRREWRLTDLGQSLQPSLIAMFEWGRIAQSVHHDQRVSG